jgi:GTPase
LRGGQSSTHNRGVQTALILHPVFRDAPPRPGARDEIAGLAAAIGLEVLEVRDAPMAQARAGTLLGGGQVGAAAAFVAERAPDVVIVNGALTPVQQRNLEEALGAKVIDRTGLILEIFGARAVTKEGRAQVELAALEYQRSRLVRSWTHLERQRGGAGFMGGPGERQIELDRRMIAQRIAALKQTLAGVRRTRGIARGARARAGLPAVALVGYTNAGKSTLFNALTGAGVEARDMLFATLDPTARRVALPGGDAVLTDTVGFIADLPTQLVEAFRATLEQVGLADCIVHVIDAARPDAARQRADVIAVLEELGIAYTRDARVVEVYNKADALEPEAAAALAERVAHGPVPALVVSAARGQGLEALRALLAEVVHGTAQAVEVTLEPTQGRALAWLYAHGRVVARRDTDAAVHLRVLLTPGARERFQAMFGARCQRSME